MMRQVQDGKMKSKEGFTLVELSLSLIFIGILSLTIALIINDSIATYRRGLTLNQVNTVGMDLVDDIRSAFQNSTSKSVRSECETLYSGTNKSRAECESDGGRYLVSLTRFGSVGKVGDNVPLYGVLCTGTYSYVWNSGYFFSGAVEGVSMAKLKYKNGEKANFRLIKVMDKSRAVCWKALGGSNTDDMNYTYDKYTLTGAFETEENDGGDEPVELLVNKETNNNDSALALYDLQVSTPAESSANNSLFYYASFILGTTTGGVNIMSSGNFCATPDDYENEKFDYCAINKFNFAMQATGE